MNPFQRARIQAQAIRELLQPGRAVHPLKAHELIHEIEDKANLGVESVPPTTQDLGGGAAVLMRGQRFIYVSDKYPVDSGHYNALVAHELGHYYLDPVKAEKTIAHMQTLYGSEGSPAVAKVEAYGARERLELQANVFARELLLPRSVALALAVEGHGPEAIAQQLNIPHDIVQQQMLDAMLLPEIEEAAPTLKPPSPDQKRAAEANERFSNVVAGPGTGKTTTLVHRVKYLIEERGVDPRQILVLTFTNKAAFELVERLRAACIEGAADIWAGTFHSFGLEFLRKYHQHFDLKSTFGVADEMQSMVTLATALPDIGLKHFLRVRDPYDWLGQVVKSITRLKEELISPDLYRERIRAQPADDPELQAKREDVATLYEVSEQLHSARNSVDYVDLISKPALAIANDRARFTDMADRYQHVLVDEYQDVTRAMVELLKQLVHNEKTLWVVGDVRQAIHHWRGASLHSLLRFENAFRRQRGTLGYSDQEKMGKYSLSVNRRSSEEILEVVKQVGRIHALEAKLPLDEMTAGSGPSGILPTLMKCANPRVMAYAIADQVKAMQSDGVALKAQAVICRRGSGIEAVHAALREKDIPVVHIGELSHAREVKLLLCMMQLLVERQPRSLLGLKGVAQLNMPRQDINRLLDCCEGAPHFQRGKWIFNPPEGLSSRGLAVVAELQRILKGWSYSDNPWSFVCHLLLEHRFAIPEQADPSVDAAVSRIRLWQFAHAVRNGEGDIKESRLSRFLVRFRQRQRAGESYGTRELPPEAADLEGVRLLTIHGSKGLEFESVHVYDVSAEHFGDSNNGWVADDNIQELVTPTILGSTDQEYLHECTVERNNLLYVALSRAKRHLSMYFERQYGRMTQQLQSHGNYGLHEYTGDVRAALKPCTPGQFTPPDHLTLTKFRLYSDCPLQYWYSEVLALRRESEADPGVRAQWAIMDALKGVAQGSDGDAKTLLQREWDRYKLSSESQDRNLWKDAQYAYGRGLNKVADLGDWGDFVELDSVVGNQLVRLPWGFLTSDRRSKRVDIIQFNRRSSALERLMKPLVNGLEVPGSCTLWLHSVLSDHVDNVQTSGRVSATKAYDAAQGLQKGANDPSFSSTACGRCSYMTICPHAPTA